MDDAFVVEEGDQQCFDLGFLQTILFFFFFFVARKSVDTTTSIAILIPGLTFRDVFQKQ